MKRVICLFIHLADCPMLSKLPWNRIRSHHVEVPEPFVVFDTDTFVFFGNHTGRAGPGGLQINWPANNCSAGQQDQNEPAQSGTTAAHFSTSGTIHHFRLRAMIRSTIVTDVGAEPRVASSFSCASRTAPPQLTRNYFTSAGVDVAGPIPTISSVTSSSFAPS